MTLRIDGIEVEATEIRREQLRHADSADPERDATTAVVLRHLLRTEALAAGMAGENDDERIDALLQLQSSTVEPPDEAACRAHYAEHYLHYRLGERLEVEHILFHRDAAKPDLARRQAETTLAELQREPHRFAELARARSCCPSAAEGGQLGQLVRGASVPEFEAAIFGLEEGALLPRVLETRFGLHLVRVVRRMGGHQLDYEAVAATISATLLQQRREAAWRSYLESLLASHSIEGFVW